MKKIFRKKLNEATRKTISCLFVLFYTLIQILSPITTVYADTRDGETPKKGEIRNNTITVEDDNIRVTKTVTQAKDENGNDIEGKYTVGFDFVGKETEISTTTPLYAVIVFDTSGSMICSDGSYSQIYDSFWDYYSGYNYDYKAADEEKIICKYKNGNHAGDHLIKEKWESAVSGAQNFAKEIMAIEDSQVSVVTFASEANTATNWYTSNSSNLVDGTIPAAVFTHPYGATNLADGINKAVTKLNSVTDTNANKIIIVISDGEPTEPDNNGQNPTQVAYSSATSAKNSGIKIFTIGYETTSTADTVLANVSGSNIEDDETTYNYTASQGNLNGIFTNIATSISNIVNASTITLTDNLGASFHFSDGTGNTYTHELETITTEGTHIEFDIEIDPDSPTGWNPTNNGYSLKYNNGTEDVTLTATQNPEVYWIQQEYNYVINYYLDDTNGEPVHTDTGKDVKDAVINVNEEKYLSEYEGYEYTGSDNVTITINKDESKNVVNIVYTKADYDYVINYYLDNMEGNPAHSESGKGNYGDSITVDESKYLSSHPGYEYTGGELDTTVAIDGNVINVLYTKKIYNYTINYYLDKVEGNPSHSESGQGVYGDPITVDESKYLSSHPGYEYTGSELDTTISVDEENNVINVIYTKKDYNYTINYYHDSISEENFIDKVTGTGNYNDPITVDEELFLNDLTGYEYVGENKDFNISVIEANNVINIVYTKQNFILEVNYFFDGTPNTDLRKTATMQYGTGVYASTYALTTNEIEENNLNGYRLHPTTPYEPTYVTIDENNHTINIYYVSLPSNDNQSVEKTTDDTITSTDDTVTYTINYKNVLHNVIGTVTLTIIDTLPLSIDESNSDLAGGTYNSENNTITWTKTFEIDEFTENYIINMADDEAIVYTVKYNDIDANYSYTGRVYTNKADASIKVNYEEYEDTLTDTDDTSDVEVKIFGDLIVEYITYDEEGNKVNLKEAVTNTELVGTPYETNEENIYGYKLIETNGNTKGTYTENTITVTYVYEKNKGKIDDKLTKISESDNISGIDSKFNYTINYQAKVTDYVGEAKVTIVDYLPYAINTNLSELDGGTYNTENNTITWIETYNIDEKNTEINIKKNISIIYLDLDNETITNKATSTIELDQNKENETNETTVKLNKGKVVVHYVEKDTNTKLSEDIILEDFVGKTYTTEEKEIEEYFLSGVEGKTSSKYTDETIVVTYIYEKLGVGTDILPPQTGMNINYNNPYIFYILSTLLLFVISLFNKKVNE